MLRRKIQPATKIDPIRVLIYLLLLDGIIMLVIFMTVILGGLANTKGPKSLAQLHQYQIALTSFEREYGYFPTFLDENGQINLSEPGKSKKFIEGLSGRTIDGEVATSHGNKKAVRFMSFSENETTIDDNGNIQIVDKIDNPKIILVCDIDGDGVIQVESEGRLMDLRAEVIGYTVDDDGEIFFATWH